MEIQRQPKIQCAISCKKKEENEAGLAARKADEAKKKWDEGNQTPSDFMNIYIFKQNYTPAWILLRQDHFENGGFARARMTHE